ncbi:MAG: sugar phosphate isomerase/epimerase [Gudongella sp.]|nr:sugar phosphate isomerase/epimerase [Gudongella sp.]
MIKIHVLNCISTIEELDIDVLNRNNIGVEIQDFVEPNLSQKEKNNLISEYKERLADLKGSIAIHGPFLDLKPSSPDPDIRRVSIEKYLESLEIARQLNADYIIFHSQINPHLNSPSLKELNNFQAKDFWEEALTLTEFKGVILLENIFEETPLMLKELIECIDNDRIRINLDIGHLNLSKASLKDWIVGLKDYIAYIHIHGNNGIYDQHNSPSESLIEEVFLNLMNLKLNPKIALEYKIDNLYKEINRYNHF